LASRPVAELAACARAVDPSRGTLATDYGQKAKPRPAEGLQGFADALATEGVSGADIRRLACENPCGLLGLRPRRPPPQCWRAPASTGAGATAATSNATRDCTTRASTPTGSRSRRSTPPPTSPSPPARARARPRCAATSPCTA